MAEEYGVEEGGAYALRPWSQILNEGKRQRKAAGLPDYTAEEIQAAHEAYLAAGRKQYGGVDDVKREAAAETPPTYTPGQGQPPYRPQYEPGSEGDYPAAKQAGEATVPPKPPAPPQPPGLLERAGRAVFGPGGTGDYQPGFGEQVRNAIDPGLYAASEAYRTFKYPFEEIGAETTHALTKGPVVGRETHPLRAAAYRALTSLPGMAAPRGQQRPVLKQAAKAIEKYGGPVPGGLAEYAPEMAALEEAGPFEAAEALPRVGPAIRAIRAARVGRVPVGWVPEAGVTGGTIGGVTRAAQGEIGERDPTTGKVIPPATSEDIAEGVRGGVTGFVTAEAAQRALFGALGIVASGMGNPVDWWEGITNRPRTEHQGTPDQPTPPIRPNADDPNFVRELNKDKTPPTHGKKETADPKLSAHNEPTDKPGSGAGGTDPDDDVVLHGPISGGRTVTSRSRTVPAGVEPGIAQSDAVPRDAPSQGSSDQLYFKPSGGPVADRLKQEMRDREEQRRQAERDAHTFTIGTPERTDLPRNTMDYAQRLRGETPATPERFAGLPRNQMEFLQNPRAFENWIDREGRDQPPGAAHQQLLDWLNEQDVAADEKAQLRQRIDQAARDLADKQQREQNQRERQAAMPPPKFAQGLERDRARRALEAMRAQDAYRARNMQGVPPGPRAGGATVSPLAPFLQRGAGEAEAQAFRDENARKAKAAADAAAQKAKEAEATRQAEEEAARKKAAEPAEPEVTEEEPVVEEKKEPEAPDPPQLLRILARTHEFFAKARKKGETVEMGDRRDEMRRAAAALKDILGHDQAFQAIDEALDGTPKQKEAWEGALKGIVDRPKVAAPEGQTGRGAKQGKGKGAGRVLPGKPVFAVKLADGRVISDPAVNSHAELLVKHVPEDADVASSGFVVDGEYRVKPPEKGYTRTDQWKVGDRVRAGMSDGTVTWISDDGKFANVRHDDDLEGEEATTYPIDELVDPDEYERDLSFTAPVEGKETTIHVEGYPATPVRYEVVERDQLLTSHDSEGNPNPDYPEEIQPRSLDREAYRETQRRIKQEMAPERLGESPSAIEGAPIVDENDHVIGGRQRTAALQSLGPWPDDKAEVIYQAWLTGHAEDFGITKEDYAHMERPTLIRRLLLDFDTDEDLRQFSENTDISPSTEMSAAEKARLDARRLTPEIIDHLDVTESGNLNTEGNRGFIRSFLATLPATERNRLVTQEGYLNSDGLRRVQNAVLTRAYNVGKELHPAIERMMESADEKVKTIQHALLRAAPEFAVYRALVDRGVLPHIDVMTPMLDAASIVTALRNNKLTVQDWLDQEQLGGKDRTIEGFMKILAENTNTPDLTDALKGIGTILNNLPREDAGEMFERPKPPTPAQVFDMERDPDAVAGDKEDAENIQEAIRKLNTEIQNARQTGDWDRVARLEEERDILKKDEPCG
jgi:hypothetical protein